MKQNKKAKHASRILWLPLFLIFLIMSLRPMISEAQTFNSQSNGSDGALDFTWAASLPVAQRTIIFDPSNPATFDPAQPARRLDIDNDNIFHFTTVFIPTNVTVALTAPKLNWAPVYWLATGDVIIGRWATLSLNGAARHAATSQGEGRFPAIPGPGGFSGGLGASGLNRAQAGFGPGAGKPATCDCVSASGSHALVGTSGNGVAGDTYGNPFLLPLIGGSGGAGGGDGDTAQTTSRPGGGAGGGAILIASSTQIIVDGVITAAGGRGSRNCCYTGGGSGAGGGIRLIAPTIKGQAQESSTGFINVNGGADSGSIGGAGRIRLEAFNQLYFGGLYPDDTRTLRVGGLVPTTPFLPTDPRVPKWPSIHVSTINGVAISQEPSASFALPDATVPSSGPVTVVFKTKNIPTTAVLTLSLVSPDTGVLKVTATFISGPVTDATWQGTVSFPLGFSRAYLQATWALPTP